MTLRLVFILIAAIAFLYSILKEKNELKLMNGLILVGFLMFFSDNKMVLNLGALLISFMLIAFVIHSVISKPHDFLGRAILIWASLCAALIPMLKLIDWPGSETFQMLAGVPVAFTLIWVLKKSKRDDHALSPLVVSCAFCTIYFLQYVQSLTYYYVTAKGS